MKKEKFNDNAFNFSFQVLREEARMNDAKLAIAIDYEQKLRKILNYAHNQIYALRAVKHDIEVRAMQIIKPNEE